MADNTKPEPEDMSELSNRQNLIGRYNRCLGAPGPNAHRVQNDFINGLMDPRHIPTFVAEYETIIESRRPMHKPPGT